MKIRFKEHIVWVALLMTGSTLSACEAEPDPLKCGTDGAFAACLKPTQTPEYYVEQAERYFNTMDRTQDRDLAPNYSELVARWEWPPWLKLTAYNREVITATDLLLRNYPSVIPERDCRAFDVQPFARCRVVFYYDDEEHEGRGCPIYEEFVFNDAGEVTFIEAWSDLPGMLPMDAQADPWGEGEGVTRLSTRVPGLGRADGRINLSSVAMVEASQTDSDVDDFRNRAFDFYGTWVEEIEAAGDDMWQRGCGWTN